MRAFALLSVLAVAGCGAESRTAAVSGTVRLDGAPVEEGAIQFIPLEPGPSAAAVISHGQYKIERARGAAIGSNRVELRAFKESDQKVQDPTQPPGAFVRQRVPAFPPEYNTESTLVREIKPGDNQLDFDIDLRQGKGGR